MDDRLRSELARELQAFLGDSWTRAAADAAATISDRRLQLAAAVLMVSLVRSDRENHHDEHRALESALPRALGLDSEAAALVVRSAEDAIDAGLSFPATVARLARDCSLDQKKRLVETLWRIAFSDAELTGGEEYLVRKIALKLGLGTADLVETKVRAREAFLDEEL
jgi:uncharacterized tellurite resistance protein B-like protein